MEYTDYWVAKGGSESVRDRLTGKTDRAIVVDGENDLAPFVAADDKKLKQQLVSLWPWLLRVFDAEGSAWGFELWLDGLKAGSATYGENAEWGIDRSDNGFDGDVEAVARDLGTTANELEACLNDDGVEDFCKQVGFTHQYMFARGAPLPSGLATMLVTGRDPDRGHLLEGDL